MQSTIWYLLTTFYFLEHFQISDIHINIVLHLTKHKRECSPWRVSIDRSISTRYQYCKSYGWWCLSRPVYRICWMPAELQLICFVFWNYENGFVNVIFPSSRNFIRLNGRIAKPHWCSFPLCHSVTSSYQISITLLLRGAFVSILPLIFANFLPTTCNTHNKCISRSSHSASLTCSFAFEGHNLVTFRIRFGGIQGSLCEAILSFLMLFI